MGNLIIKGGKRGHERSTIHIIPPKFLKSYYQGGSSSLENKVIVNILGDEEGEQYTSSPIRTDMYQHYSLYNDMAFDVRIYTSSCLSFQEDFPGNFHLIIWTTNSKLSNIGDNHMLRGILMERVLRQNHIKVMGDLIVKEHKDLNRSNMTLKETLKMGALEVTIRKLLER